MPATQANKINLLSMDATQLAAFVADLGEKPFRAGQLKRWLHHNGADCFDAMTDLSKSLREKLNAFAEIRPPEVVFDRLASDGTRKWLLRLDCGNCIETVYIPERGRGTLCVSSQVGCTLDCSFCHTAKQGYNRNLSAGEIIAQLWLANKLLATGESEHVRSVTNVVFMGMGEPLLNFDAVVSAIHLMLDDNAYGLSKRRVTVSTAGVVPLIDRLREACPVSLAVSLHAPTDALRDQLVPLNKKYPIEKLLDACRRYIDSQPRRRITFEYIMLAGVNDSVEHARQLVAAISWLPSKVNLIPFNPFVGSDYGTSTREVIDRFRDCLMQAGIMTITRKTRGDDIEAACGQLAGQVQNRIGRKLPGRVVSG